MWIQILDIDTLAQTIMVKIVRRYSLNILVSLASQSGTILITFDG